MLAVYILNYIASYMKQKTAKGMRLQSLWETEHASLERQGWSRRQTLEEKDGGGGFGYQRHPVQEGVCKIICGCWLQVLGHTGCGTYQILLSLNKEQIALLQGLLCAQQSTRKGTEKLFAQFPGENLSPNNIYQELDSYCV